MKVYLSVLILFFISSGFVYAQEQNLNEWVYYKLDPDRFRNDMKSVDSVKIAIFFLQNKETGMPPMNGSRITEDGAIIIPPTPDIEDRYDLISDSKLTKKEISKLNKYLLNPSTFVRQIALPETEDIEIHYFSQGKVIYRILLSAYTRNLYLLDRSDERLIAIQMKKNFHHFIGNLLKKRKESFWNQGMEFMFFKNFPD